MMLQVILYHSTIVEPVIVLGLGKEPLVIKLKQLGQLGEVKCLHGVRNSTQGGMHFLNLFPASALS